MVDKMPDVAQMNAAAALLLQEEDFASFCKSGSDNKRPRNVTEAKWCNTAIYGFFTLPQTVSCETWYVQ